MYRVFIEKLSKSQWNFGALQQEKIPDPSLDRNWSQNNHLLCWHKRPSGKQRLPVFLTGSRPQSSGNGLSIPVATGLMVPPVPSMLPRVLPIPEFPKFPPLSLPPNIFITGRKTFWTPRLKPRKIFLKNWASLNPHESKRTRARTEKNLIFTDSLPTNDWPQGWLNEPTMNTQPQ